MKRRERIFARSRGRSGGKRPYPYAQAAQRTGRTLWCNPGSLTRIARSPAMRTVKPVISMWVPGMAELEAIEVPHRPFEEVFIDFDTMDDPDHVTVDESMFIRGLENLAMRKTSEGVGLRAFLKRIFRTRNPGR